MAGISANELQNIIGRAQKLCSPAGDRLVNANIDQSGFRKQLDESYDVPSVDEFDDGQELDALFSATAAEDYGGYSPQTVAKSKLPENVKRSMVENPIVSEQASVLDSIGIKPQRTTAAMQRRAQINEGRQPSAPSNGGGVDYSIIKAIVSQCINEALANSGSNGGVLTNMYLQQGTITLVDDKGNIFRAKLEKIGNKNDKK